MNTISNTNNDQFSGGLNNTIQTSTPLGTFQVAGTGDTTGDTPGFWIDPTSNIQHIKFPITYEEAKKKTRSKRGKVTVTQKDSKENIIEKMVAFNKILSKPVDPGRLNEKPMGISIQEFPMTLEEAFDNLPDSITITKEFTVEELLS